jgi:hypothetical protein
MSNFLNEFQGASCAFSDHVQHLINLNKDPLSADAQFEILRQKLSTTELNLRQKAAFSMRRPDFGSEEDLDAYVGLQSFWIFMLHNFLEDTAVYGRFRRTKFDIAICHYAQFMPQYTKVIELVARKTAENNAHDTTIGVMNDFIAATAHFLQGTLGYEVKLCFQALKSKMTIS